MSCSGDNSDAAGAEKGKSLHATTGPSSSACVVDRAAKGFATNGSNYDAFRPGYTEQAVEIIAETVLGARSCLAGDVRYHVLELGAGTGKLTQQLVAKLPSTIRYLATEPSRNFLESLESKGLGVDMAVASTGDIPLPDASVQTVVCAQCFHWFADTPNLESIRRVMVPGGKLVLIWNVNNMEDSWMKPMGDQKCRVIEKVGGSLRHLVNTGEWRRDIDTSALFSLENYLTLPGNNVVGDLERIVSNVSTISAYNMLSEQERKACMDELRDIIGNWPGVDKENLVMVMSTLLVTYEAK